jgi:hypothetical protein
VSGGGRSPTFEQLPGELLDPRCGTIKHIYFKPSYLLFLSHFSAASEKQQLKQGGSKKEKRFNRVPPMLHRP